MLYRALYQQYKPINPFTLQWLQNQRSNTNYCLKLQICSSVEKSVHCLWYLSCWLDINVVFLVSIFSFSFFFHYTVLCQICLSYEMYNSQNGFTLNIPRAGYSIACLATSTCASSEILIIFKYTGILNWLVAKDWHISCPDTRMSSAQCYNRSADDLMACS